jgi:hypothetical protein
MSWIRSLVLFVVLGLVLFAAPTSFADGDEAKAAAPPPAEAEESAAASEAVAEGVASPAELTAEPAAEAAESAAASAAAGAGEGVVARAVFTTAVADREPSDELSVVPSSTDRVYFFTELLGIEGQRVTHRWEQAGQVRGEVGFDVVGPRWRVWSSKQMLPDWTGEWRVTVVDESGAELATRSFSYQAPEAQE